MKTFNLVFFLVILHSLVNAQEKLLYGIQLGGILSTKHYVTTLTYPVLKSNDDFKLGYSINLIAQVRLSWLFSAQIEPGIVNTGSKFKFSNYKYSLTYITMPLNINLFDTNRIWPFAGTYFSYLISSKIINGTSSRNIYKATSNADFGLNAGIAWKITDKIRLNAKYFYGILNLNKIPFGVFADDMLFLPWSPTKAYNRGFSVNLIYFFVK